MTILIVIAIIITIIILIPCIGVAFQRPQRSVKHWVFIRNMLRDLQSKDVINYHSELREGVKKKTGKKRSG